MNWNYVMELSSDKSHSLYINLFIIIYFDAPLNMNSSCSFLFKNHLQFGLLVHFIRIVDNRTMVDFVFMFHVLIT